MWKGEKGLMTRYHVQKSHLVLLVEDNEDDVFLATRAFRSSGATDVVVVRDGAEALEFLFCQGRYSERHPAVLPQLVLLDINLPVLSGIDVLRRLRADDRTRLLPVVMLSSSLQERDLKESYGAGANSYLQKPVVSYAFEEMVQKVKAYWLGLNLMPGKHLSPDT